MCSVLAATIAAVSALKVRAPSVPDAILYFWNSESCCWARFTPRFFLLQFAARAAAGPAPLLSGPDSPAPPLRSCQ